MTNVLNAQIVTLLLDLQLQAEFAHRLQQRWRFVTKEHTKVVLLVETAI